MRVLLVYYTGTYNTRYLANQVKQRFIDNKNQVDTTDMEFGSFNEEEDQFINKKQLVHIEDDTSINVDVSEDDRSKSSSLKKSFLINNISAFNEQFPVNNQLTNK